MRPFEPTHWAVILGGSSGFGLATADKLSRHGMNVAIAHRDRRGSRTRIQPAFDAIAARVGSRPWNVDALSAEGRDAVLAAPADALGPSGWVRLLMHSIAFGDLRLVAPLPPRGRPATDDLAAALGLPAERQQAWATSTPRTLGLYLSVCGCPGTGRALGCKEIEFAGQIRPFDEVVRYEVAVRRLTRLMETGAALVIADAAVAVDGAVIHTIAGAKVGTFLGITHGDYPNRSRRSRGGIMRGDS